MPFHIEEIRGRTAFEQIEPIWSTICREQQHDSFFLSPAWAHCCLAGEPDGTEPLILVLREDARPVGIVPVLQRRERWRMLPARTVSLLENQDSPFVDIILPRTNTDAALAAVLAHLDHMPGWHVLTAPKIRRTSAMHSVLAGVLRTRPHLERSVAVSPVLVLEGTWDTYWKATSQRFKKTVRNVANRVERLGTIAIGDDAEQQSAEACMQVFRQVAARGWKATLPVSVTNHAGIDRFFVELTHTLHTQRQLSLWVLRLDGVPIATEYHVRDGDTVYALRSDFDERYGEASPGAHLNAFIIRSYFERGVRVYDMGPGEAEYKQRWASATKELHTFWVFNRTVYGAALYNLERHALPQLRRARGWWQAGPANSEDRTHA